MNLPDEIMDQLKDEFLTALCRNAVELELLEAEHEAASLRNTRGPFAILARRETRIAQACAVHAAAEKAAMLRARQAQVDGIEQRIREAIRAGLEDYLLRASSVYQGIIRGIQAVERWGHELEALRGTLTAFASELQNLRAINPGLPMKPAIATLYRIAQRLETAHLTLAELGRECAASMGAVSAPGQLPELAVLRRLAWVQRLASISADQRDVECALAEAETRRFLAQGLKAVLAQAQVCRAERQEAAARYLEQYWVQLRGYTIEHYDEDVEHGQAMATLVARYLEPREVACQTETPVAAGLRVK